MSDAPNQTMRPRISRPLDTILGIGYLASNFSLGVGCIGLGVFVSPWAQAHIPAFILLTICILPWFTVFAVTFTKQPFLPPRRYRYCLMFSASLFAAFTIFAEVLHYAGYIPSDAPGFTTARVWMHVGWLSLFHIIVRCRHARLYELQFARPQKG